MKKLIVVIVAMLIFASCSWEYNPHLTTFEESIEEITADYGDPILVIDTVWYPDGIVRNRVAYWNIDPPEYWGDNMYGQPQYYTSVSTEVWNQPYSDQSSVYRHNQYGWEMLRWSKGNFPR